MRWMQLIATACVVAYTSAAVPDAAPVEVRAEVGEGKITIGDPITYTVIIQHTAEVRVKPPRAEADLGPFEVRDFRLEEQPGETRAIYEIAVFDVGPQTIPALEIPYVAENGQPGRVKTEPIRIHVESVLPPDANEIRDIRGPKDINGGIMGTIVGALVALAVLAALLVGVKLWRGRPRPEAREVAAPSPPPRPPEEVAYEELDALARSDLLPRGMVKEYYTDLGDILRRYIEGLCGVAALESTTHEIVAGLIGADVALEARRQFESLLGECDVVKFAKHRPAESRWDEALDDARRIIDVTKPQREQRPATGKQGGRLKSPDVERRKQRRL